MMRIDGLEVGMADALCGLSETGIYTSRARLTRSAGTAGGG